jgi:hypothetical protein
MTAAVDSVNPICVALPFHNDGACNDVRSLRVFPLNFVRGSQARSRSRRSGSTLETRGPPRSRAISLMVTHRSQAGGAPSVTRAIFCNPPLAAALVTCDTVRGTSACRADCTNHLGSRTAILWYRWRVERQRSAWKLDHCTARTLPRSGRRHLCTSPRERRVSRDLLDDTSRI